MKSLLPLLICSRFSLIRRSVIIMFAFLITIQLVVRFSSGIITDNDRNDVDPLFLTPYIRSGNISGGVEAAKVKPFAGTNVVSYSGFLTVDSTYDSNLFFWFFPRNDSRWQNSTLVLWLQGGPGTSSLFALFEENGPYVFKENGDVLRERYYSWTTDVNLLYVDNPVGVGFSFTGSPNGYARNQTTIAENLYEAVRQFFQLFPSLQKNSFVIAGQSYAGKYIPNLAAVIHRKNNEIDNDRHVSQRSPKINLYGLFIGNPLIEGEHMLHYSDYFYWIGLLDEAGKEILASEEERVKLLIKSEKWEEAATKFEEIFFENSGHRVTLFGNLTAFKQHYHFLLKSNRSMTYHFSSFVQRPEIRKAIHVGQIPWNSNNRSLVYEYLKSDLLKTAKPVLEYVLQHYKVLIHAGQLDIICPFYLVENVVHQLNWRYADRYESAARKQFRVDQYLAGYYKTVDKLTTVLIRNAGHIVPRDKPQWARVLLRRFVSGRFSNDTKAVKHLPSEI